MSLVITDSKHPELLRQIALLNKDMWFRVPSICVILGICGYFVDSTMTIYSSVLFLIIETLQYRAGKRYRALPSRESYLQLLIVAVIEPIAILLPIALLWTIGEVYPRLVCVIMLTVSLLHIVLVRSPHLIFGFTCSLPPMITFYYLIYLHHIESGNIEYTVIGLIGISMLNIYFFYAIYTYNKFQRALLIARDSATAASASKSRFLAAMSHELRTPLNAIMGVSQLLREQPDHPSSAKRIVALEAASRSLKELVDDVLDLTRIEQGQTVFRPIEVNLIKEVNAVVDLHRPIAMSKGLTCELQFTSDLMTDLTFDPLRVRQCITNLLSNALKFTERGAVRIRVKTLTQPDETVLVEINVSDTGIGVPQTVRQNLFEIGFQAHKNSTSPAPGNHSDGAGLGLAISRSLARQMGGDITYSAGPDSGATFSLSFQATPYQPEQPHPQQPAYAPFFAAGRNVLVVDDIATNRMVAAAFIQTDGMHAVQVEGGAEALQMLHNSAFDLVLLDMNMPHMSGLETFAAIRASGMGWANIPVIALTADAMPEDAARYLRAGLDGYLAKPLDRDELRARIAAVLASGHTNISRLGRNVRV